MIHSQEVNILDKNYNPFSSTKGLPFNFVLTFFTVSTTNRSWGNHLGVMRVSITQWRVEIGTFHTRFPRVSKSRSALLLCNYCTIAFYFVCCNGLNFIHLWWCEPNLGPKNTKFYYFSFCHWNLNSVPAMTFLNYHESMHTIHTTILIWYVSLKST